MVNLTMRTIFRSLLPLAGVFMVSQVSFAQPSLEVKGLLRQGMKECRAAKTLRRTDLQGALERFQAYRGLVEQALLLDEDLLDLDDSTVRRVLDFCNAVKADLDRAEALPLFERGLVECREARVSLANGAFEEARNKQGQYIQFKESAIALTESVLNVYENSYELQLCEQLDADIEQARQDYQRQATAQAEGQKKLNEVINLFTEALSQCRGAQSIINDKARYTNQTSGQVRALFTSARTTKKNADNKYAVILASNKKPGADEQDRINRMVKNFLDCEAVIPSGLAMVSRATQASAKTSDKPSTGTNTSKKPVAVKLKDTEYTQIVGATPRYPTRAARKGIEGHVVVRFTVTKTGDVSNIQIVESKPKGVFDKSATAAVKKYKYQPRISQGVPVDAPGVEKKIIFRF